MFGIGDFAVCPGHGVGQICDIEEKEIAGQKQMFYSVRLVSNGMKILIPTSHPHAIRRIAGEAEIQAVFTLLCDHSVPIENDTWNRRYRDYMVKVKSGSILEIADVMRVLLLQQNRKGLSFGEKKVLVQCRDLLVQEISISQGSEKQIISGQIDACFRS